MIALARWLPSASSSGTERSWRACASPPADCAARGRVSRGTRPSGYWLRGGLLRRAPIAHVDDGGDVPDHRAGVVELRLVGEAHELASDPLVRHFDLDVHTLAGDGAVEIRPDGVVGLLSEHFCDRPSDQIGRLQPEACGVWPIDELEPVLGIAVRDHHRRAVGDESQLPLTHLGGRFRLEPRRHIAIDFDDHALAAGGIERPARVDADLLVVPPRVHEAAFPHAFVGQRLFDHHQRLREARLQQAVRHLSDRFGRGPAEGPFRSAVPVEDFTGRPPHRHRVVGMIGSIASVAGSMRALLGTAPIRGS